LGRFPRFYHEHNRLLRSPGFTHDSFGVLAVGSRLVVGKRWQCTLPRNEKSKVTADKKTAIVQDDGNRHPPATQRQGKDHSSGSTESSRGEAPVTKVKPESGPTDHLTAKNSPSFQITEHESGVFSPHLAF
jgi:hypothetical protein